MYRHRGRYPFEGAVAKNLFRLQTEVGEYFLLPCYGLYSEQNSRIPSESLVANQNVSVAAGDQAFIHIYI
jgi:hypothetical protein